MIFLFTLGGFGGAFLLARTLNWLALIPWRRTAGAHWTVRARCLFLARMSGAINIWLIAVNVSLGLQLLYGDGASIWLAPALAAWLGAIWSSYFMDREVCPGVLLKKWLPQFVIYTTFFH